MIDFQILIEVVLDVLNLTVTLALRASVVRLMLKGNEWIYIFLKLSTILSGDQNHTRWVVVSTTKHQVDV
jgi:hypothetical protein